jgi:hypothetical protein
MGPIEFGFVRGAAMLARGPVHIELAHVQSSIIVSAADVTINGIFADSVIIARGKIKVAGIMIRCRVVSGCAIDNTTNVRTNIVSQNDPNPLGFIRWAEPPKEKAKSK